VGEPEHHDPNSSVRKRGRLVHSTERFDTLIPIQWTHRLSTSLGYCRHGVWFRKKERFLCSQASSGLFVHPLPLRLVIYCYFKLTTSRRLAFLFLFWPLLGNFAEAYILFAPSLVTSSKLSFSWLHPTPLSASLTLIPCPSTKVNTPPYAQFHQIKVITCAKLNGCGSMVTKVTWTFTWLCLTCSIHAKPFRKICTFDGSTNLQFIGQSDQNCRNVCNDDVNSD
jgi:hypothetical protein